MARVAVAEPVGLWRDVRCVNDRCHLHRGVKAPPQLLFRFAVPVMDSRVLVEVRCPRCNTTQVIVTSTS